jgi:hypothetical protein
MLWRALTRLKAVAREVSGRAVHTNSGGGGCSEAEVSCIVSTCDPRGELSELSVAAGPGHD